ncbi:MAG: 39S ribosomal protein L45 [Rickettsiales bacterium]|nr:39S ribosomal protein L45 [Rickettsiales bacterium]
MDIIFFAAVAFYVVFKLREQLGKVDEDDKKRIEEKIQKRKKLIEEIQSQMAAGQAVVGQHSTQEKENKEKAVKSQVEESIVASLDEKSKSQFLDAIKACNISAEFFLNGAKSAFEMVVKAFAVADLETLKFLLADKIYSGFDQAISTRRSMGQNLVTNLIAIDKAEIIAASMIGNDALVTVKFFSRQINYVTDQKGDIIEGKKDEIFELSDVWKFKRDVTVNSPNWLVIATNSN